MHGRSGRLPAVALTAYASRQDATKAISAGFDAHVAKPVQPIDARDHDRPAPSSGSTREESTERTRGNAAEPEAPLSRRMR